MSSPAFRAVLAVTGKRLTFLPHPVSAAAFDVAISVEQLCDGLARLCGPWIWEGFPTAALRQPCELDARIWKVRP